MSFYRVIHSASGEILAKKTETADNFFKRLLGLMFVDSIGERDGLLISKCNSIHTFFMKFSIDAIFIDKKDTIVALYRNLSPWRLTKMVFHANRVLELSAGATPLFVKIGDQLRFECIS